MSDAAYDQLDVLVQLQDVDCLIKELRDPEMSSHEEKLGFVVEGLSGLERTRERLASQVEGRLLQAYERMSTRIIRVIVPIDGRVCAGCRMNLPTSSIARITDGATFDFCENCGRILYRR